MSGRACTGASRNLSKCLAGRETLASCLSKTVSEWMNPQLDTSPLAHVERQKAGLPAPALTLRS